ncbi:hypothetical protein N7539_000904 [Penicillium diatomitis]|uniref:Uncharacterized protein n=1 Tax=Penicillium diatomitis TaxID=2819901 RepID=A0A9X0C2L9_9EURO|nr:uncharacterized protein N7539_000904 [Penicillium diatomitis]KAJ5495788.1 hypothetical protein N7539_000904 [Penicillium diatomitis]
MDFMRDHHIPVSDAEVQSVKMIMCKSNNKGAVSRRMRMGMAEERTRCRYGGIRQPTEACIERAVVVGRVQTPKQSQDLDG